MHTFFPKIFLFFFAALYANKIQIHDCELNTQDLARYDLNTMSIQEMDCNWKLDKYFGSIYVINLDRAPERLYQITQDLYEIGIDSFERFSACDGQSEIPEEIWQKMYDNWRKIDTSTQEGRIALESQFRGEAGCYLSHFRLIEKIKQRFDSAVEQLHWCLEHGDSYSIDQAKRNVKKYSSVLILEDDCSFGIVQKDGHSYSQENCGYLFRRAMQELPLGWDMLYFVVLVREPPEETSLHLRKLKRSVLMNAYAVHHTMYQVIIDQLKKIENPNTMLVKPLDVEIGWLHAKHQCYAIFPSLAFQRQGASSITSITWKRFRQYQPVYIPK